MNDRMPRGEFNFDHLPPPLPLEAYRVMARVLRGGLILTVGLFAIGVALFFSRNPTETFAEAITTANFVQFYSPSILFSGLARVDPQAVLTLGVIVLVVTPMARVVTGAYFFHEHGERAMTLATLTVLTLLVLGAFILGPYLAHL
jgi:uncharacterized membrane protein